MFFSGNIFFIIMLPVAYLLGAVSFGYLIATVFYGKNLQKLGSGNIGATNVWRVVGPLPAVATFLLDSSKGALLVFIVRHILHFSGFESLMIGLVVVVGHCYSYLLHFKGGKGVATAFGVLLVVAPFVAVVAMAIWLTVFVVTRLSSLAALTAWFFVPILFYYFAMGQAGLGSKSLATIIALTLLIYFRHQRNILALMNGTEQAL